MEDKLNQFTHYTLIKGVIYVGANDGEEFVQCKQRGISNLLGFEPLTAAYLRLISNHPDVPSYNVALGSANSTQTIEITQNDKASSLLQRIPVEDWRTHEVFKDWNMGQWPIVGEEQVDVVRFDEFAKEHEIDVSDYNLLFMDVQGMELDALVGFGDYLDNFDGICVELSETPVYVGEASASEVVALLKDRGFERISDVQKHDDVLFVRKGLA